MQALRLALRNINPPTVRLGAKVNFASSFYMSAMRWTRVRKLGLNLKKESNCLRTQHVIAMKQCVNGNLFGNYSNYNFDMYPQYVSTEVEYMRESIASAARIMSEQSEARHISWMKALP